VDYSCYTSHQKQLKDVVAALDLSLYINSNKRVACSLYQHPLSPLYAHIKDYLCGVHVELVWITAAILLIKSN